MIGSYFEDVPCEKLLNLERFSPMNALRELCLQHNAVFHWDAGPGRQSRESFDMEKLYKATSTDEDEWFCLFEHLFDKEALRFNRFTGRRFWFPAKGRSGWLVVSAQHR